MSNLPYKVRIDRINIAWALFLLSMPKKVKEALRTRLRNKISWTEISVRLKKIAKWKTILDRETLVCYENLPICPTVQFFLCVTVTPLHPKSVSLGVYTAFPQITQKLLITDTCRWLEPITVILGSLKIFTFREAINHFRTTIFSQSPRFYLFGTLGPLIPVISSCENTSCM